MKRQLELVVKIEISNHKENLLYELLGKYGDKLPKDIQKDMRQYAGQFKLMRGSLKRKLVKEIKI